MAPPTPSSTASVIHTSIKQVPILTSGKLTPDVILQWDIACDRYFGERVIAEDSMVVKASAGFQDVAVTDWYRVNRDKLNALSWAEFLNAFRKRWLPRNWVAVTEARILSSRQREMETFEDWCEGLEKINVLLRGTSGHFSEARLRSQLSANAVEELRDAAAEDELGVASAGL